MIMTAAMIKAQTLGPDMDQTAPLITAETTEFPAGLSGYCRIFAPQDISFSAWTESSPVIFSAYLPVNFSIPFEVMPGGKLSSEAKIDESVYIYFPSTGGGTVLHIQSDYPLPVIFTMFSARFRGSEISLDWRTATEVGCYGYEIERMLPDSVVWEKIGFLEGSGNSSSEKEYSFTDKSLSNAGNYKYRLKQIDNDGTYLYSDVAEARVSVTDYALYQCYPNPFNPSTTIKYQLPEDSRVLLTVYNSIGEKVTDLVDGFKQAGYHEILFDCSTCASGIYFYTISTVSLTGEKQYTNTKKMQLVK